MKRILPLSALAAVAALVSACGFTPIYGQTGEGAIGSTLSRVAVSTPDDRLGYRLREQLEDAFGRNASLPPQYRLDTTVEQSRLPLGRRIDDTATRYQLNLKATWTLVPLAGGEPIKGERATTTTYASADQPYAAIAAQQDGEDRAAADLARLLRLDLMRVLGQR